MDEIRQPGLGQVGQGLRGIMRGGADIGIGGLHRADVMVGRHGAAPRIAEFEADRVVHGQRKGPAHACVVIGGAAVDLGAGIGADDGGGRAFGARAGPADAVHHVDEIADGFIKQVDLAGLGPDDPVGRVGAEVEKFHPVQVRATENLGAPPGMVGVAFQHAAIAHHQFDRAEGACSDAMREGVAAVVAGVQNGGRIVGKAGDEGDVGGRQVQRDGQIVGGVHRAVAQLAGLGVDQPRKAAGHGVARRGRIAPARDVPGHVGGGEAVPVAPGDAAAQVQHVAGRVVIDLPAVQQHAAKGAVAVVFDQVFQKTAGLVAHLAPVIAARVAQGLDVLLDAQRAATRDPGLVLRVQGQAAQGAGRCCAEAKAGGAGHEVAPVDVAVSQGPGKRRGGGVRGFGRGAGRAWHRAGSLSVGGGGLDHYTYPPPADQPVPRSGRALEAGDGAVACLRSPVGVSPVWRSTKREK